jgi:hypothetical protein
MTRLAGAVTMAVVDEYGPGEMLRRLSDPWWFQAFGCVLGFDWHSSGITTVTCGALKEAAGTYGDDLGIVVAGGKGRASRRAPREIAEGADRHAIRGGEGLVRASRMSAKVDSAAVQDGHQIYHHSFFFAPDGAWCVVQQGMDGERGRARRYHWLGASVRDFVCEPHAAVRDLAGEAGDGRGRGAGGTGSAGDAAGGPEASGTASRRGAGARDGAGAQLELPGLLNLVARESGPARSACAELARQDPDRVAREVLRLTEGPTLFAPEQHRVLPRDVDADHLRRVLRSVHERHPGDFETLLGSEGVGPAAVRSLALLAEVVHGAPASRRDPAAGRPEAPPGRRGSWPDFAYAHGGKDGHPYPVDTVTYDQSVEVLHDAVRSARLGDREKSEALRRLAGFREEAERGAAPDARGRRRETGARARDHDMARGRE